MTPEEFHRKVRELADDVESPPCSLCAPWREASIRLERDGSGVMTVSVERVENAGTPLDCRDRGSKRARQSHR